MTQLTISKEILQNVIKLAIEKNDDKALQSCIDNKWITLDECVKLITETGKIELVMLLLNKPITPTITPTFVSTVTPTFVSSYRKITKMTIWALGAEVEGNQLMYDVYDKPARALEDLKKGIVSKEEINQKDSIFGWTALHRVCFYMHKIIDADQLIRELINKGADINTKTLSKETPLQLAFSNKTADKQYKRKIIDCLLGYSNIEINMPIDSVLMTKTNMYETLINILINKN